MLRIVCFTAFTLRAACGGYLHFVPVVSAPASRLGSSALPRSVFGKPGTLPSGIVLDVLGS
jgi:hypothetical protein